MVMIACKRELSGKKTARPVQSYFQYSYLWRGKVSGHKIHRLKKTRERNLNYLNLSIRNID